MYASYNNHLEVVKLLLAHPGVDVTVQNNVIIYRSCDS